MFDVLVPIGISVILKRSNYVYIYDIIKLWRYEQQWNEWLYIYMLYPNAYKPYIAAYFSSKETATLRRLDELPQHFWTKLDMMQKTNGYCI